MVIAQVDTNQDGKISYDEFVHFMTAEMNNDSEFVCGLGGAQQ